MSYAATVPASRALRHAKTRAAVPAREATSFAPTSTPIAARIANTLEAGLGLFMMSGVSLILCTIAAAAL